LVETWGTSHFILAIAEEVQRRFRKGGERSNAIYADDLVERKGGPMEQCLGDKRQVSWRALGRFWNKASRNRVQQDWLQNFAEIIEKVWFDGLLDAREW
jgi:hypothetical protein